MRTRQPFYGDPEDAALIPGPDSPELPPEPQFTLLGIDEMANIPDEALMSEILNQVKPMHPDYCEKGTEQPLGLIPHRGANRQQRRSAVANFQAEGADRRELWQQRQRQRRGKLDPELRRLQKRKAQSK